MMPALNDVQDYRDMIDLEACYAAAEAAGLVADEATDGVDLSLAPWWTPDQAA